MPPISPEQLAEVSGKLEKLTLSFEESILEDISRRISKAGITETAEYQLIRLKELGYANDFIVNAISKYTEKSSKEIERLFFNAGQCSDEFYRKVYSQAGIPFTPLAENAEAVQWINAGISQTKNELKNFTASMGFSVRQPDGTLIFKPAAVAYQETLDLANMQVSTGVFDYNTAVRNATLKLSDSGLRFVDYASGHVNHADVAVRRAVLTGVSQLMGKISENNAAELGTDIVEVTAHAGARPDHAEWQGGWFSLSGKSKEYKSLTEATGYGTGAGLKGWNCRHDFYPVIPGISTPAYTKEELENIDPPPIEYNGRMLSYYECTQKQRQMETVMRKTKREIIAAKGSDDSDRFTAKSILLRRQKEEYAKFSEKAGLLTQFERSQVYGFNHSVSSKSAWAVRKNAQNNLTGGSGNGIIKKTVFAPATSVKEAEDYAKNILGISKVTYNGCDLTTANEWNRGLNDAFNKFPELKKNFGFAGECHERNNALKPALKQYFLDELIKSNPKFSRNQLEPYAVKEVNKFMNGLKVKKGVYAKSWSPKTPVLSDFKGVTVNRDWGQDSNRFIAALTSDVNNKFHPAGCDTIRSVLDHEIGHQLDDLLDIRSNKVVQQLFNNSSNSEITDCLSIYAWKNTNSNQYSEMIAEAWAEYCNNPQPRRMAKLIGEVIIDTYNKKFGIK